MMLTICVMAVALFGACVGSFLNVVIFRVPHGTFFTGGKRSHCRTCDYQIQWYDNLPVLSWMLLRGKCRSCAAPIGFRYPLVEIITALALAGLFYHGAGEYLSREQLPGWSVFGPMLFQAWLICVLIACTFIDIDHRILPDVLTKPTMAVGVLGAAVAPGLVEGFARNPDAFDRGLYSVVGLLAGLGITQGIRLLASKVFGREAMGFGDVKFMGAIGAFVGWDGALTTFFLGSLFGAFYGGVHQWLTKEAKIFFGPFLALGAAVTLFFKQQIIEFVTVTWPEWQASVPFSPLVSVGVAVVAAVLLLFLIRRGRNHS